MLRAEYAVKATTPKRGSHWKLKRPGFRPYTIPSKKGAKSEVSQTYLRAMCRALDIDEAELLAKLK